MRFSFSAPKEIARGLKRIWESKLGTPSLARIIQDVDLALKALEIVYRENGAAFEGLADSNGHRLRLVGEGKSVSWGGARTKGTTRTHKKYVLSQLSVEVLSEEKHNITEFFLDTTVFYDYKTRVAN